MAARAPLVNLVRKFVEQDPPSSARILGTVTEPEAVEILRELPSSLSARLLTYLQPTYTIQLLQSAPPELFKDLVEKLDPQRMSEIVLALPEKTRHDFLEQLSEKNKRQIEELLQYPDDSAGRLMTPDYFAFHIELTVREVIQKIRTLVKKQVPFTYAYVVDDENHLVGVLNMRDLMLAPAEASVKAVMRSEVFWVNCFTDRETVARELQARQYSAAPVVDAENRLLGLIKAERLIGETPTEVAADIQKMFGAGRDERPFSTIGFAMRKRLFWLNVNLATAFLAAGVVALFEDLINRITALAIFMPVVAGQGGNAGAQTLAVVMRGLVMREIPKGKAKKLILKEAWLGILNGLIIGVVTALIAWFWRGDPFLGLVIGLGMIVCMFSAGLAGAAIPLAMKAIGLDPAQSSNIILTTVTDVVGMMSYLGFGLVFVNFLKP